MKHDLGQGSVDYFALLENSTRNKHGGLLSYREKIVKRIFIGTCNIYIYSDIYLFYVALYHFSLNAI